MHSQKESNRRILRILGVVFIVIALALLGGYACTKLQEHREIKTQNSLQEMFDTTGSIGLRILDGLFGSPALAEEQNERAISGRLTELYAINPDLIGWLIAGGDFSTPVVWRDNSYYLYRDFYRKDSKNGTLFLDEHHPLKSTTQHMVIHGHNMTDGSMFGLLPHYRDKAYVLEHGVVTFSTLYEKEIYAVVAVAVTPEDMTRPNAIPNIGMTTFSSEAALSYYMDKVRAGALYNIYLDVKSTDALLTLSTCLGDDRLLLVCRRLRAGETESEVRRIQRLSIE